MKLDIPEIEVFQRYYPGELREKANRLIGLCPFHNERNPSFGWSIAKNRFKCFGCGKSGSAIDFVMLLKGLEYKAAVKLIAKDFNLQIKEKEVIDRDMKIIVPKYQDRSDTIMSYMLFDENSSQDKALFAEFGIFPEGLDMFYIRACKEVTFQYQDKNKVNQVRTIEYHPENPLYCIDYRIEGAKKFYRPLQEKGDLKFIANTNEFDLFGLYQVIHAVEKRGKKLTNLILAAGNKDTVSIYCNTGIYAVALNSENANLTPLIYQRLKRFAHNIYICYDIDKSGIKRQKELVRDYNLRPIELKQYSFEGKDASEMFRYQKMEQFLEVDERRRIFKLLMNGLYPESQSTGTNN